MISGKFLECMQIQGHRELFLFDPKPERTLHRLRKETHVTQLEIMQHPVDIGHVHDGDEPHVEHNGHNYRNLATTPTLRTAR